MTPLMTCETNKTNLKQVYKNQKYKNCKNLKKKKRKKKPNHLNDNLNFYKQKIKTIIKKKDE